MARWEWVIGGIPPSGVERRALTQATGRQLTLSLDQACLAQFVINGRSDEVNEIVPLGSDLHIYRDGVKVLRGRIGSESDQLSPNTHTAQFSAIDYRGLLRRRLVGASGRYFPPGTPQGVIALTLINESQALPGGNLGITAGMNVGTDTPREATFNPGDPIGEKIAELGRLSGGFDWEVSPALLLNRWHSGRGTNNGVVLDYGGLISSANRVIDPDRFANHVLATGDQGLTPSTATDPGVATDPRGRWEGYEGFTGVSIKATLDAKATWLLGIMNRIRPAWTVTLTPGTWQGTSHIGLGDTVTLAVKSGRIREEALQRVTEIRIVLSDDGDEEVSLGMLAL